MDPGAARRHAFVAASAAAQLLVWLVVRPDVDDDGTATWLGLETVAAVVIGASAPERSLAIRAVLVGWALQMAHYVVVVDHERYNLWAVGSFLQLFLAGVALGIALLTGALVTRVRRRTRAGRAPDG